MAVSLKISDTPWIAVWKNRADATAAEVSIQSGANWTIKADFSRCEAVSRLLWPLPPPEAHEGEQILTFDIELAAMPSVPPPIEWIAIVHGASADRVVFLKKLKNSVEFDKVPRKFRCEVDTQELREGQGEVFLCLQFLPGMPSLGLTLSANWSHLPQGAGARRPAGASEGQNASPTTRHPSSQPQAPQPAGQLALGSLAKGAPLPAATLRAIAAAFDDLPVEHLAAAWNKLEEQVILKRIKAGHRDRNWPELVQLGLGLGVSAAHRREALVLLGRAQIYANETGAAAKLLSRLAEDLPADPEANLYAGVALTRESRNEEAVEFIGRAIAAKPDVGRYWFEQAVAQRRMASRMEVPAAREALLLDAVESWKKALELDPRYAARSHSRIAQIYLEMNRVDLALTHADRAVAEEPEGVDGLMTRGRVLLALNRVREALTLAEQVYALAPTHQGAQFHLRALRNLVEDDGDDTDVTLCEARLVGGSLHGMRCTLDGAELVREPLPEGTDLAAWFAALPSEWIVLDAAAQDADLVEWLQLCRYQAPRWCGRIIARNAAGGTVEIWRRDLLRNLVDSEIIGDTSSLVPTLSAVAPVVATVDTTAAAEGVADAAMGASRDHRAGLVIAVSRHGIVKFGGGEQFLDSMAEHYEGMGHDVLIAGTRPERVGESGVEGGRNFAFVDESPQALRRFFIERRPALVHVLSGLGFQVATALNYLNIPFVYGVHFWRDCLGLTDENPQFFDDLDRGPIPKPTFRYVLQRAATVYSNSLFTREVLEEAFQCRTPVLYSLPRDVDAAQTEALEADAQALFGDLADFVLLVNAAHNKGFGLLLEVAKLVPSVTFVAIASQTDAAEAQAAIQAAMLSNFRVLPRTDRIELLYHRARVVAVPSYRFVETFSRVCIEAQRYRKPVLGSDRGNVPYLLRESGVILPEEPAAWAAELHRIYSDDAYHASLVDGASANSGRYAYDTQRRGVHGLVSTLGHQILIGAGSGIGNMLHAGPMVRNIARRLGRKVDVVVAEDHRNSLFLLHHSDYVNATFSLKQNVLRKHYDTVFLTHCFGDAPVRFLGRRVISSRSWRRFEPAGPFHETIFNLEAAKHLLRIDYDEADINGYYVGDFKYSPPKDGRRIGLHGGSKEGFWTSKRWPRYQELAEALISRGYEVASFGIEPEYVEGTLDLTGGSIAEMTQQMLTCSYFISNDSGLMNIANALGIPLTSLFGPTNPATRGPLGPKSTFLAISKDCAPCEVTPAGKETFVAGRCRCIAELDFDRVLQHVLSEMGQLGLPVDIRDRSALGVR